MEFSPDQAAALESFWTWYRNGRLRRFVLAGLAGTGKSTLTSAMIGMMEGSGIVRVAAPTGKAAQVLRRKGSKDATTIHGLIYKPQPWCNGCERPRDPREDADEEIVDADDVTRARVRATSPYCDCDKDSIQATCRFYRVPEIGADLIIIDEASMVSTDLLEDIESFGVRLVFIGDHGQLAPVGADPGLMADPTARLEQIHRQGPGSGVVTFAHAIRSGAIPTYDDSNADVDVITSRTALTVAQQQTDIILTGRNRTRVALNGVQRRRRGFDGPVSVGEPVICLRNEKDLGLYNGMILTVTSVAWEQQRMWGQLADVGVFDLEDELGEPYRKVRFLPEQFGAEKTSTSAPRRVGLFDWAYAITTHKSQGSEWDHVLVIDEGSCFRDEAARWRYTAATRAAKRLTWYAG